jgi:hypothetical protein
MTRSSLDGSRSWVDDLALGWLGRCPLLAAMSADAVVVGSPGSWLRWFGLRGEAERGVGDALGADPVGHNCSTHFSVVSSMCTCRVPNSRVDDRPAAFLRFGENLLRRIVGGLTIGVVADWQGSPAAGSWLRQRILPSRCRWAKPPAAHPAALPART